MNTHSDSTTPDDASQLGATLEAVSDSSDRPVVASMSPPSLRMLPLPGIDRCDCRIQALEAIRLDIATWTLLTVPDLDIWAQEVAAWIVELPTELLQQGWMAQLILALDTFVGLSIERAADLIQLAVGRALLTKEGWA